MADANAKPIVLEVKDLTVNYGVIAALHGISLQIRKGDIVTLIGGNGAGKTTTLRAISGLLRASGGSVTYEGEPIHAGLCLQRFSAPKRTRTANCWNAERGRTANARHRSRPHEQAAFFDAG